MKIKYICKKCKKPFFRFPSQRKSKNSYCSLKCLHENNRTDVNQELIYDLYYNKKLSKYTIAEKLNISYGVIYNLFQRNSWKFRTRSEALSISKSLILDKTKLKKLYLNKKCTLIEIAEYFDCSASAIKYHLDKCKIIRRTKSEAVSGNRNSNWQGGITEHGYSHKFNNNLKTKIRKRDNYVCQHCGITEEEHKEKHNRVLEIHHIDYDKENNTKRNLVSLCRKCHGKTNHNRDYWFAYHNYIIKERNK